ncbi:MAG TPA: dihydropteroate synthase [Gemmatimonadaceae bacterium]|nr:dihydropteroate synthase [Gemmatimonadaceae bacterium]
MSVGARIWRAGGKSIVLDKPIVVGILNVTPDSFSDGGLSFSADSAVTRALQLLEEGADVVDVGGESTRPGAEPVDGAEELRRVVPVIDAVRAAAPAAVISVDTVKAATAQAALVAGADIVNDVSAGRLDSLMLGVCASAGCGMVLMHSRGSVGEMASYGTATYGDDVVGEISSELLARVEAARQAGVDESAIVIDPGIGFSKRSEHSIAVLRQLGRIVALGYPVMVGVSRKRVIGELSGVSAAAGRDAATHGANVFALGTGAVLFRVHDVRSARLSLDTAWRLSGNERGSGVSVQPRPS